MKCMYANHLKLLRIWILTCFMIKLLSLKYKHDICVIHDYLTMIFLVCCFENKISDVILKNKIAKCWFFISCSFFFIWYFIVQYHVLTNNFTYQYIREQLNTDMNSKSFSELPLDCIECVLEWLSSEDVKSFGLTCEGFKSIANSVLKRRSK